MVVLAVLLAVQDVPIAHVIGGITAMLVLLAAWFAFGGRAETSRGASFALLGRGDRGDRHRDRVLPVPRDAAVHRLPDRLVLRGRPRRALVANGILVVAVAVGMLISVGTRPAALASTGITCLLSLGLSLGIGLWFRRVYAGIAVRQQLIDELGVAQARLEALGREAGAHRASASASPARSTTRSRRTWPASS